MKIKQVRLMHPIPPPGQIGAEVETTHFASTRDEMLAREGFEISLIGNGTAVGIKRNGELRAVPWSQVIWCDPLPPEAAPVQEPTLIVDGKQKKSDRWENKA